MLTFLFFMFSFLCGGFAYLAMTQKNSIHAICSLIFVFLSAFFLMLFIDADFLAFTYVIVYVGAISVFFLFAVMLLDLKADEEKKYITGYMPIHVMLALSNWLILNYFIITLPRLKEKSLFFHTRGYKMPWYGSESTLPTPMKNAFNRFWISMPRTTEHTELALLNKSIFPIEYKSEYTLEATLSDVIKHGITLYFEYGEATIALGALLFLAMFGVICLTFEYAKAFTKKQFAYEQHNTTNTIVLIS